MNKSYFVRFPIKDQILFIKRLGTLISAGVPILRALEILRDQMATMSFGMGGIFKTLIADTKNGQYLHVSLARYPNIFGEFTVNIIRVGETSGTLSSNLAYLADELKKKQALRRKVMSSMIYPIFIVFATLGVTGLLTFFVFPKILPIFKSLNFELPLSTRILIGVSTFFLNSWVWIIIIAVSLVMAFILLMRFVPTFRRLIHRVILTIPIFGSLAQSYQMSLMCRTLGLLLKSGVMIMEAASISARTTLNLVYRRELKIMEKKIIQGGRLSEHMYTNKSLFPPIVAHMLSVGEESGNLSDTLLFLGDMYEKEVEELTTNLTNLIEPVLMVFMGVLVGFVAISIITPIYEVTQHIQP
ncbi:MAG: hypothetical protein A2826_01020 [Candidatus Doudnabacteria bacterium RIFCSPHIGHO2_01_FULL_43_23]|uniref:Type II secretion system protein GspF domain-containing protein n=1 Tax=Candidatus Doudnabacteria bacterium RIFCSPHIGHO2_01_FULL_43_23 TaxID=1817822 RepID=A0A1F5NRS1_9BACT|nr:MAG: hypothetical protein A2826_01020 [Candidatus Doudnabacteria bacterium RIFCSPHIGHO2_01_FULL_43_23]